MTDEKILEKLSGFYSIKFDKIEFVRKGGSITYCIWGLNKKYFLKIIPLVFIDTVRTSLDILIYLEKFDFPSPRVILTKDGFPYIEVEEYGNKTIWVLFNFIEGVEPDEGENIETIGDLVGRLHSIMKKYKGNLPEHDKDFFIDRYINILHKKNYNINKIQLFRDYGDYLWEKVKNIPRGFAHGDLHRGNLLKEPNGIYNILDFDTASIAFPVYDIMVMCNSTDYFQFNENGFHKSKRTYDTFLKGYTKHCTLTTNELNVFYDFIGIYHYQLQATIMEIYGLDCVDYKFLDNQLDWLMRWREQCARN